MYHFCIIIKLKSHKVNHCEPGPVCGVLSTILIDSRLNPCWLDRDRCGGLAGMDRMERSFFGFNPLYSFPKVGQMASPFRLMWNTVLISSSRLGLSDLDFFCFFCVWLFHLPDLFVCFLFRFVLFLCQPICIQLFPHHLTTSLFQQQNLQYTV